MKLTWLEFSVDFFYLIKFSSFGYSSSFLIKSEKKHESRGPKYKTLLHSTTNILSYQKL